VKSFDTIPQYFLGVGSKDASIGRLSVFWLTTQTCLSKGKKTAKRRDFSRSQHHCVNLGFYKNDCGIVSKDFTIIFSRQTNKKYMIVNSDTQPEDEENTRVAWWKGRYADKLGSLVWSWSGAVSS
jgi:hypothetical protein